MCNDVKTDLSIHGLRNFQSVQVRGAASALQISTIEFFAKKVTNVYLKALTVLNKSSILDALIGLEYASASRYSLVLKIQTEISP